LGMGSYVPDCYRKVGFDAGAVEGPREERGDVPITSRGLLFLAVLGDGPSVSIWEVAEGEGGRDGCGASGAG